VARDLQNNTLVERDHVVNKSIHYRGGGVKVLSDAELVKVIGAGTSKAIRNAILNCIPDYFKKKFWDECRRVDDEYQTAKAGGKQKAQEGLVSKFGKLGVTPAMIVAKLGHPVKEATDEERMKLRGWYNAIENGEAQAGDIFGPAPAETGHTNGAIGPVSSENFTKGKVETEEQAPDPPLQARQAAPPTPNPGEQKRPAGKLW